MLSLDLFQKAVIQSGATLSPWGLMKQTQCQAKRFAAKFNCPTDDTHEMVQCLKQIDARTLVYGHIEAIVGLTFKYCTLHKFHTCRNLV